MKTEKISPEQLKGAHGTCATVRVASDTAPGGFVEMDAHTYNAEVHGELYVEPKAKKAAPAEQPEDVDYASMNKAQLIALLNERGISHDPKAKKDDLIALINPQ